MPSFEPITAPTVGTLTPANADSIEELDGLVYYGAIIDSTYGDLGGSYGDPEYAYGGFVITFDEADFPSLGAFTLASAGASGAFTPS